MGYINLSGDIDQKWTKIYSVVLKIQALVFATIFPVGYFIKFGVAWHDAGQPFNVFDVKFHPYWNMILIIYTGIGCFLFMASRDIIKFKVFLSFCTWVAFFAHGCVATVAVLTSDTPNYVGLGVFGESYPETYFSLKNGDKVLALAIWFGNFAVGLYFSLKVFGHANLPWNL
mmetsp:Transcript_63190/g.105123  ORF Transcript_63190/g.105123 Transcript_63190/m.105123 type:complete len:172 (+) Transcript_63190:18-533(+)